MKESVRTIELEDLRVKLTRLTTAAYEEMVPRAAIFEPYGTLMQWHRKFNMGRFFWAMTELFGEAGHFYERERHPYSFPFRLDVTKGKVKSIYSLHITLYTGCYEACYYRYLDTEIEGLKAGVYHDALDEFPQEHQSYCLNYIGGMCNGYGEAAPKPDFYYRCMPKQLLIFGCQDDTFFNEYFEERDPKIGEDDDGEAIWEAKEKREQAAYQARVDELALIGPEFEAPCNVLPEPDDTLDYPGYSRVELDLIRKGEARCLLRQLHHRFGEDASQYRFLLDEATTYQLACWAESILTAPTLKEVFILPNIEA